MKETVYIDWFLLISHFLWIFAAAVSFALLGIFVFKRKGKSGFSFASYLKTPLVKKSLMFVCVLILLSLICSPFRLPPGELVTVTIGEPENGIKLETLKDNREFLPAELKLDPQNRGHRFNNADMKDNTLILFWDGSIQTPFMVFPKGRYSIQFQAWGTGAKGVFPKIKIEFESPDSHRYLIVRERFYLELSKDKTTYKMPFEVKEETIGRVRITYFNDLQIKGTTRGRDVWFKDAAIQHEL